MDKYEYKVRADEINRLIAEGDYAQAAEIADTIDWRRVKSVMMLCTVSDLYKINRRYDDAKNMLLLAYERRPGGRTICYSLCELCIKTEDFVQAVNFYKEFVQAAPKDPARYILQYRIYEAQDVRIEERIGVLEELKKRDYREKWAYELAYLYHRVGLATRCVEECDELILWFGEGKYVVKAMELKMLHQPLTPAQQEMYDHRFDRDTEEQPAAEDSWQEGQGDAAGETAPENTAAGEEYGGWPEEPEESRGGDEDWNVDENQAAAPEETAPEEELDIHVKTMDVSKFNTINLQEELAAGLQEVLGAEEMARRGPASVPEEVSGEGKSEYQEDSPVPVIQEQEEEVEVFFGETGEIKDVPENVVRDTASKEEALEDDNGIGTEEAEPWGAGAEEAEAPSEDGGSETPVPDSTGELIIGQMREEAAKEKEKQILAAQPPRELAGVLSQEADGQIRLVMPEHAAVEKQITGQMRIEDILSEWERMKKENQERCREGVRQHVLQQTGPMFTEFEAAVRDGLLEKLETDMGAEEEPELFADVLENFSDKKSGSDEADEVEELTGLEEYLEEFPDEHENQRKGEPGSLKPLGAEAAPEESREPEDAEETYPEAEDEQIKYLEDEEESGENDGQTEAPGDEEIPGEGDELTEYLEDEEESGEGDRQTEYLEDEEGVGGDDGQTEYLEDEEYFGKDDSQTEYPEDEGYFGEEDRLTEYLEDEEYFGEDDRLTGYPEDEEYFGEDDGLTEYPEDEEESGEDEDQTGYPEDGEPYGGDGDPGESQDGYEEDEAGELSRQGAEKGEAAEQTGKAPRAARRRKGKEPLEESALGESALGESVLGEGVLEEDNSEEEAPAGEQSGESGRAGKRTQTGEQKKGKKQPIEQDKAKVRGLTREEKELYAPFIQSRHSREQLVKAIDNVSMAAYTGNIVITGEEGMDTLTLAKNMIREVKMEDSNFAGKVAKITGRDLNQRNVKKTLEEMNSGALIIYKASGMSGDTAKALYRSLQQERLGIVVVLEDTKKAIQKLFAEHPELAGAFTARVDMEALSNDMLVLFGKRYAREKEYSIDELGVLALHTRIEELQTIDHVVTVIDVKRIVDEAIRHADRKTLGHFFDVLFAKRYDDEDMVILTEKDFVA